jgi:GPI mannosyltransferase 3
MLHFLEQQLPGIPVRLCLFITVALHLGCAWFSEGYYNPDEHFQILEFANYKLGLSPASDLAWEYPAKIRPAVQPAMAFCMYRALAAIHLANPFAVAFLLRLCMSVCAWLVAMALCIIGLQWLSRDFSKKILFLFSCFFWFLPYFHCRFSSENSAGIAFFAAFAILLWNPLSGNTAPGRRVAETMRFAVAGFLFGFSFYFRYQIGIAILGMGLWLLFFKKASVWNLFCLFTAFCVACFINMGIDRWFYGSWALTPVNYFIVNVVKGVSSEFGVSPWWYYIVQLLINFTPPFSVVILGACFLSWYKCPKNPMVWVSFPFFLLHCAVSHKEFRFLFPMLYALPALIVLGIDRLRPSAVMKLKNISANNFVKWSLIFFIAFDLFLLLGCSFKPGKETIAIYKWIYKEAVRRPFSLLVLEHSPYRVSDFPINYYRPPQVTIVNLRNADSLKRMIKESKEPLFIGTRTFVVPDSLKDASIEWKVECRSIPQWLKNFNINHWLSRVRVWTIYSVKRLS